MRDPNKLTVTDQARSLAVEVYRLASDFPASERFGLAAQMRRAAVSVGSNIAEGCGRSGDREFVRFLQIARGSSTELAFQLAVAMDLGLCSSTGHDTVAELIDHVQRMLNRLTASMRQKREGPRRDRQGIPVQRE